MNNQSTTKWGRPKMHTADARTAAKLAGQCHYFEPVPCLFGHVSERYVSNGGCVACANQKRGKAYAGPRIKPDVLAVIDSARKSELRSLDNIAAKVATLQHAVDDMRRGVILRYQELRMSLANIQSTKELH